MKGNSADADAAAAAAAKEVHLTGVDPSYKVGLLKHHRRPGSINRLK